MLPEHTLCYLSTPCVTCLYLAGAQGSGESHQERVTNLLKKLQLMDRCLHEAEKKSEEVGVIDNVHVVKL